MTELQQYRIKGEAYFFTFAFPFSCAKTQLRAFCLEFVHVKQRHPFHLDAFVILPKYVQGILTLPIEEGVPAIRWGLLEREFIKLTGFDGAADTGLSDANPRRFFGHSLHGEQEFASHLHFLHFSPVRHGLVKGVADWPYSTFFQYVQQGVYSLSWRMDDR